MLAVSGSARHEPDDAVPFELSSLGLDLRVDYGQAELGGAATLGLRNASDVAATAVPLLLGRLMTVASVTDAAGTPLAFTQRVVVFADDSIRQVNAVTVRLPAPLAPGDSARLVVRFGGFLVGYTETGSLYIKDHVARDFTILREDAFAFPVLGAPAWTAYRSVRREPFAFAARVTVPAGLVVATAGTGASRPAGDSLVTWEYRGDRPVPFLNIAIAPYRVLEGAGSRIFHFPADAAGARMVARAIARAVGRLTSWYGPPGAAPRLTVVEIPEGYGSQASLAAGILQTADAFRRRAELPQLYHEITHVWNVPDGDRPSPRWNEGLATFLQWRLAAALDGWDGWPARLQRAVQGIDRTCRSGAPCDSVPFAGYGGAGLTDLSYPVGLLMFYALRAAMGSAAFDRAYRDFFQRFRETGAPSDSLVAVFRRTSPAAAPVFDDWFASTRWRRRLAAEGFDAVVAGYRRGRPAPTR